MFGSRLVLAPRSLFSCHPLLSCHPERSEGSAFRLSTLHALGVSAFISSDVCPFNFKLSTVNFPPLTPFPATLTDHRQLAENTTTLSPAVATLTTRVKHKSCICHSYRKHPGWGSHPSSQEPILFCLGPRLFWNWHLRRYPGVGVLSFRPIRVGQPILAVLFPVSPVTDHGSRTTSYQSQGTKPFRIRTYGKRASNSFRIRTYKTRHLKPFRMNTYKKNRGGVPTLRTIPNHSEGARHVGLLCTAGMLNGIFGEGGAIACGPAPLRCPRDQGRGRCRRHGRRERAHRPLFW